MIYVKPEALDDLVYAVAMSGGQELFEDDFEKLCSQRIVTNNMLLFIVSHVGWVKDDFYEVDKGAHHV